MPIDRIEPVENGRTAVIRCEGACSSTYADNRSLWISKMRAAGFNPEQVRANLSWLMRDRPHVHIKRQIDRQDRSVTLIFACTVCQHERPYGVEEL